MERLTRYALNPRTKVAHLRPTEERCNWDDAVQRVFSEVVPPDYRLCSYCRRRLNA